MRADVRAHCAIGERALPECAHKKRLLAHLVSLRFAAERRAALCVFDRRRRDARDEKKPGPGPASMAPDAKTTSKTEKRKPNDLVRDSFGETDRVEWHLTASASRTDNGKDDPWWFADGVVVLVTAADAEAREENENENEKENVSEAPAPRGDDDEDDDDDDDDEKTKPRHRTVSTQFPDERFFDSFGRETTRTRETTWASESPSARLVSEKKKPETTSASAWSFPSLGDWSDWSGADADTTSSHNADSTEVSVLSASDVETTRRLARQLASPRDVFVIVEMCDGADGRVALENALDAAARATGIDASRILCLESTLDLESNAADVSSRWRAAASAWYRGEWARERAATLWPAFAEARATVRFWGALGGDAEMEMRAVRTRDEDGGSDENERIAPPVSAASALRSAAEAANEPSTTTSAKTATSASRRTGDASEASAASVPAATASALASAAASRSLYSFLRWAIEGRPQFGVAGAPAIAAARLESDPGVMRRAALSAALYSYSAAEFAAGFLLSWAVPGPLAAHAAHFTNRFRVCFAVACMAGASPLDPRVAAVVLATCAGADGAAMKRAAYVTRDSRERESASTTGRVRDGFDVSNGSDKPSSTKTNDDDGNDEPTEPTDASTSRSTLFGSLTSAVRRVADGGDAMRRDAVEAMRRVYDAGGDAIRRAERDAERIATRVFRVALVSERKKQAFETEALTDDAFSRRRVMIASPESAALTMAQRAFANRLANAVASECAAVVCGPLWLAATQADVVSVLAGAMSVHVCNASLQVFLPPRGTPVTTDASLLSSNAGFRRGRGVKQRDSFPEKETSLLSDAAAAAAEMASDAAASARDVAAEARRVAAEASSNVTRWASAAASAVLMQRGNVSLDDAKPEAPESKAKATAPSGLSDFSSLKEQPPVLGARASRASLLALVADDDARALARSPSAVVALMSDTRVAAAMADHSVRRTLGAFVEASQKRNESHESRDVHQGEMTSLRDVLRRNNVSEEDESAVFAAVDRAAEVLLASGDADARVVAERHGLVGVSVPVSENEDAAARRAFEAAKASRYAGYRDAVEKARGKYFLTASVAADGSE